jgi:hypothetical protein
MDRIFFICLSLFALLYAIFNATNIEVAYGKVICGGAALALGIICAIRAFR